MGARACLCAFLGIASSGGQEAVCLLSPARAASVGSGHRSEAPMRSASAPVLDAWRQLLVLVEQQHSSRRCSNTVDIMGTVSQRGSSSIRSGSRGGERSMCSSSLSPGSAAGRRQQQAGGQVVVGERRREIQLVYWSISTGFLLSS